MKYTYNTQGVCSRSITFDVTDGIVTDIKFAGGCNGNLKGIAALCEGQKVQDVIERLEGLTCGFKKTSCPDQLAKALQKTRE